MKYRVWSPDRWSQQLSGEGMAEEMLSVFGSIAVTEGLALVIENPAWTIFGRVVDERLAIRTRIAEEFYAAACLIGAKEIQAPLSYYEGGWGHIPRGRWFSISGTIPEIREKLESVLSSGAAATERQKWFSIPMAGSNMPKLPV